MKYRIILAIFFFQIWVPVLNLNGQSPFVKVDGSGLPVVMIPGGSFSTTIFDPHAKALSLTYKVIRIDRLNAIAVKTNTILPENYSVRMESDALGGQLDSIGIGDSFVLIGPSYGALIAMDFALRFPEKIRTLILVEPPAFWVPLQMGEHPVGMDEMISITKNFGPRDSITEIQLEKFRCAPGNCADGISPRSNPQWPAWVKDMPYLRGLSAVAEYKNSIQNLKSFTKPVLIFTGNKTVPFHRRIDELLAGLFPQVKEVSIKGGHGACISNATQEFIDAVKIYLESL